MKESAETQFQSELALSLLAEHGIDIETSSRNEFSLNLNRISSSAAAKPLCFIYKA